MSFLAPSLLGCDRPDEAHGAESHEREQYLESHHRPPAFFLITRDAVAVFAVAFELTEWYRWKFLDGIDKTPELRRSIFVHIATGGEAAASPTFAL
jgi:hypothetical protein